jgi:hypothetical protein
MKEGREGGWIRGGGLWLSSSVLRDVGFMTIKEKVISLPYSVISNHANLPEKKNSF